MSTSTITIIAILALLVGAGLYFYMDIQAREIRTEVVPAEDGPCFIAKDFSVEVQRTAKCVIVKANRAAMSIKAIDSGLMTEKSGQIEVKLPAAGLGMDVLNNPRVNGATGSAGSAGKCSIRITASDEKTLALKPVAGGQAWVISLASIALPVALDFEKFAGRVQVWVQKVEHLLEIELKEKERKQEEQAKAAEQEQLLASAKAGMGNLSPDAELTDEQREAVAAVMIDKWRKDAGFAGEHSKVSIDSQGRIDWFIDLCEDGRITLHNDARTIHTTLHGAIIVPMDHEMEIGVRDEYWTEEDSSLRFYRVLKGVPVPERRAWQERLEIICGSLGKYAKPRE